MLTWEIRQHTVLVVPTALYTLVLYTTDVQRDSHMQRGVCQTEDAEGTVRYKMFPSFPENLMAKTHLPEDGPLPGCGTCIPSSIVLEPCGMPGSVSTVSIPWFSLAS